MRYEIKFFHSFLDFEELKYVIKAHLLLTWVMTL